MKRGGKRNARKSKFASFDQNQPGRKNGAQKWECSIFQRRTFVKYGQANGNYIKQYTKILLNIDNKSHGL